MIRGGQQGFLSNLILLLVLNLLVKPVYILGIDAEVQAQVGPEIYGSFFALLNISFLLNIFCDLGINNYNTREIALQGKIDPGIFGGMSKLRIILGLIYIVIALFSSLILGYRGFEIEILLVLALNQVLASFILFFRSNLTGLHLFRQDSLISVLDRLILIIGLGYILFFRENGTFDIRWLVYGQTVAYLITAVLALILLLPQGASFRSPWNSKSALETLKASYPYALLIFMMMVYNRTDGVMLERMLDDNAHEAGIYARSYRFFEALNMVAYLFAVLLLPMFSRALQDKISVRPLVKTGYNLLFFGSSLVAIIGYYYSDVLLSLRYSDLISESSGVLQLLLFGFIAVSLSYVTGTLLTASGDLRSLNRIALFSVGLNIVLNLWLIPKWGAWGSALATVFTQWFALIAQSISIALRFKPRPDLALLFRSAVFTTLLLLSGYLSTIIQGGTGLKIGALIGTALILGLLTKILNLGSLMAVIRDRLEA